MTFPSAPRPSFGTGSLRWRSRNFPTLAFFAGTVFAVLPVAHGGPLETVPEGEAVEIRRIADLSRVLLLKNYIPGSIMRRDAHAKHHGCAKATVQMSGALAAPYAVGSFQPGSTYPAWIRFSNANGTPQPDTEGDARGFALKLIGVSGSKILPGEVQAQTHDLLFINHDEFFVRNAVDYVAFNQALVNGKVASFFFPSANPQRWRVKEARIVNTIRRKRVADLLSTRFWSTTPYLLGEAAVKYSVTPCPGKSRHSSAGKAPHYLAERLATGLAQGPACYELAVQLQADPGRMPVEDSTTAWDEDDSPFVKIATITLPVQDIKATGRDEICENLSFTPWHALPEQRPLGNINRVRKAVYQEISALRHEKNAAPRNEPTVEDWRSAP